MGKYLETWMQTELPKLQSLLMPEPPRPTNGMQQPEGATTFAAPPPRPVQAQQTFGSPVPSQQPQKPVPPTPTFGEPVDAAPQQPMPGPNSPFAPQQASGGGAAATFEEPFGHERSIHAGAKPKDPKDIENVDDLMQALTPQQLEGAYTAASKQYGGAKGINGFIQRMTGNDPQGLSKREKTELMIEFGLRLASNSSADKHGGDIGAAVADAGLGTIGSARQMKANKTATAERQADRAEKAREADLRATLLRAQTEKAKGDKFQLKTDSQGRLQRIDLNAGTAQVILGDDGAPLMANSDAHEFASEVDRSAYESAYCEGLTGDDARACKQRALIFSKGGAPELAFPELSRVKIAERTQTMMENPDNKRVKYRMDDGTQKAYADMSGDEKVQAANLLVNRWVDIAHNKLGERTTAKPAPGNNWGLGKDDLESIKDNERVTLDNGTILTRRNGKVLQVDKQGNPTPQ